jgi:long-chain acyl-CoA synthetase
LSVVEGLKSALSANPAKTAAVCGQARLTFSELDSRIDRMSAALTRLSINKGDRVGILSLNCHRFLELYFAVPQTGAVVVPINFRIPPQEVRYILDHSAAVAIAVDATMRPLIDSIRHDLKTVRHFISMANEPVEGYLSYEALVQGEPPSGPLPRIDDGDLMGLFYTSGTTGEPKGVMLSHRNIKANVRNSVATYDYRPEDIFLHVAPMFHLADGAAVFIHTSRGATQVFIPRFEPGCVLEAIQRERVSMVLLVPTMINFMLQHPELDKYDLSSVRHITYGASPIAPEVLKRAMKAFGCNFGQGYGLTEAAPLLTVLSAEDHQRALESNERLLTSCGRAVPGVEVRVVDPDMADVKPGEVGEIIARGQNIMAGYWRRPDDTKNAIRGGWLFTGDLATIDDEGYLYLVDRKKDMIVTGGENVFSTEVEAVIYQHSAIKEVAVISVPSAAWGEAVHACIAVKDGQKLVPDELIEFCRGRLANYKIPRSIEIIDGELPKGGSGKILKKQLRERYWGNQTRRIN